MANYLPDDVLRCVRLDTLRIEKDSFVDEHLREQFSDLLYRVDLNEGMDGLVYMLFEHKSYPDKFVAVQLLRYMGAIWEQWLKGQKGATTARLPVIIPIVFYHGAETWIPLKLSDLAGNSPVGLCSYVPSFDFLVSDFSTKFGIRYPGCKFTAGGFAIASFCSRR